MGDDDLINDGFKLSQKKYGLDDIAMISLKIAINAYFSTYHAVMYNFIAIKNPPKKWEKDRQDQNNYMDAYFECYAEAITHFHHYIELKLKRILEKENPLLVIEIKNPLTLYKLVSKQIDFENIPEKDIRALGFREILNILCALIKEEKMSSDYKFILEKREDINKLNNLRNRLVHRGMYILRYKSFDNFIGKIVLPFIDQLVRIGDHKEDLYDLYASPLPINCNINPLKIIIEDFKQNKYNMGKIALLKELGRAWLQNNYNGETYNFTLLRQEHAVAYENAAKKFMLDVDEVKLCPVCGMNTLLSYFEDVDVNEGSISYVTSVRCIQCGFELQKGVKNASEYGLSNIEDWF